jgi:hypothetical protein
MTQDDQIMVMLGALDLVRERLQLDFLIEDLKTDIGKVDYYDYAERTAKAWLVRELSGEETIVPLDTIGKASAMPTGYASSSHCQNAGQNSSP